MIAGAGTPGDPGIRAEGSPRRCCVARNPGQPGKSLATSSTGPGPGATPVTRATFPSLPAAAIPVVFLVTLVGSLVILVISRAIPAGSRKRPALESFRESPFPAGFRNPARRMVFPRSAGQGAFPPLSTLAAFPCPGIAAVSPPPAIPAVSQPPAIPEVSPRPAAVTLFPRPGTPVAIPGLGTPALPHPGTPVLSPWHRDIRRPTRACGVR